MTNAEPPADLTRVISELNHQDREAVAELLPVVYADLRRLADGFFQCERADHTLQPTALVHEAYLRLIQSQGGFKDRAHFFRTAAMVMRHILCEHARGRGRQKRGGDRRQRQDLDETLVAADDQKTDVLELDEALQRLTAMDARQGQIVELRFFAGLSVAEVAELLGVSKRTVEEDWTLAKAWLQRELKP
jgi:RNA polymerase sigma factor (TIGR02999 family)